MTGRKYALVIKHAPNSCVRLLTGHYGMESLLSVNAVTSDDHLRDLRRLYDRAEANIRSLKALGVEPESYGAMLSSVLLTKLPPDIRLIVSRKVSADDLDMDSLLETFEQELIARERANNSSSQPQRRVRNQGQPPTSAFVLPVFPDHQFMCFANNLISRLSAVQ